MIRPDKQVVACILALSSMCISVFGQINKKELAGSDINTIQSVVPFLTIAPDSRSGAMGDIGAATSPDVNSMHWNPAKFAFINGKMGMSISYSPWLRRLVPDINLAYIAAYHRFDKRQVIATSLLYFSLGNIIFTDEFGNEIRPFNPNEFAIDISYARKFSDHFSGAMAFRYIYSNLTGGTPAGNTETKPGTSFAADVAVYYQKEIKLAGKDANFAFGSNISNIGKKMSYTETQEADFIPINLRIGTALNIKLDDYNTIQIAADANKLLVPTPPIYDSTGTKILHGMNPNVSVPVGMFHSFFDAPGFYDEDGHQIVSPFEEELREIMYSFGFEYWYAKQFAVRTGYFHEAQSKGNRKFFAAGLGLRLNVFELDFAYLIPTKQNHPLAGTLRFTLGFDFESLKKQNKSRI
jgi:hypothetical protein